MRGSKVRGNNLGEGLGCRGNVQGLPGQFAKVAGAMCRHEETKSTPFSVQLKVKLGLQVREEFDNYKS